MHIIYNFTNSQPTWTYITYTYGRMLHFDLQAQKSSVN